MLNYFEDTLKSQFSAGLFCKDTAGSMDSVVINNSLNSGLVHTAQFSANSREVHLLGPLHAEIFFSDLGIELSWVSDAFALMCANVST